MFGAGFLISWNDVDAAVEADYRRWHREEHMPERLAVPGFLVGRRYVDAGAAANRYLTVYETTGVDVFASAPYRARLAQPTPDTARMSARMRNFVRRICRTQASTGAAIGGAALVCRLRSSGADAVALSRALRAIDGTVAAHFGRVDEAKSGLRSDALQSQMAAADVAAFDAVLIAEADSRATAQALDGAWRAAIARSGADVVEAQVYALALIYRPAAR